MEFIIEFCDFDLTLNILICTMESTELILLKIKNPFNENKMYEIEISRESTILELKEKLCAHTKLSIEEERLVFRGKILKNEDVISSLIEKNEIGVTFILVEDLIIFKKMLNLFF